MANAVLIPLVGKRGAGLSAVIDEPDAAIAAGYRWSLGAGGYVRGHRHSGGKRHAVQLHALICGTENIDHRDGNKLDCRRNNLRPATRSQNNANRRAWSKTGFKGVRLADGRYTARIQANGREIHLGSFGSAEEAARAYDAAALEYFGEFARTNFPQDATAAVGS